ncbi:MAG: helix-turn-helix domain-containing protein [Planctomycetota bacterium]|jgi:AraC-like DNA-binding protein
MTNPDITNFIFSILDSNYTVISNEWSRGGVSFGPFSRLYLFDKGKAQLKIKNKKHTLKGGNIYIIPERTRFQLIPSPGAGHYWIHFTNRNSTGLSLFDYYNTDWEIPLKAAPSALDYFKGITELFQDNSGAASLKKQAMIRMLSALFIKDLKNDKGKQNNNDYERLSKALSFIEDYLTKPISVEDISEIAHLHPNYFSNLFRQHFGIPPMKYVLQKRIEKAQILLCSTEKPVKNIAIETGFNDPCYFTRFFSKYTGMTPMQYRISMEIYS